MYERGIIEESFYIIKNESPYKIEVVSFSEDEDLGHEFKYYTIATKDGISKMKGFNTLNEAMVLADDVADLIDEEIKLDKTLKKADKEFNEFHNQINNK